MAQKNIVGHVLFGDLGPSASAEGTLDKSDVLKAFRAFLVVVGATAAYAAIDFLVKLVAGADLGPWAPIIIPLLTPVAEAARRFIADFVNREGADVPDPAE